MKNKEITIYELIGLIKDGKAPAKIKFRGEVYYWSYDTYTKNFSTPDNQVSLFREYRIDYCLNQKIEILPEKNEEWEEICELLNDSRYNFSDRQNGMTKEDRRLLDSNFKTLGETINQIIKNQKYLKERLDKDE